MDATLAASPPKDYMMLAVFSLLFGFLPFGVVAIVFANKVGSLRVAGQIDKAQAASRKALRWSIVSLCMLPALLVGLIGYGLLLKVIH